jgi:hypothetical protein
MAEGRGQAEGGSRKYEGAKTPRLCHCLWKSWTGLKSRFSTACRRRPRPSKPASSAELPDTVTLSGRQAVAQSWCATLQFKDYGFASSSLRVFAMLLPSPLCLPPSSFIPHPPCGSATAQKNSNRSRSSARSRSSRSQFCMSVLPFAPRGRSPNGDTSSRFIRSSAEAGNSAHG